MWSSAPTTQKHHSQNIWQRGGNTGTPWKQKKKCYKRFTSVYHFQASCPCPMYWPYPNACNLSFSKMSFRKTNPLLVQTIQVVSPILPNGKDISAIILPPPPPSSTPGASTRVAYKPDIRSVYLCAS